MSGSDRRGAFLLHHLAAVDDVDAGGVDVIDAHTIEAVDLGFLVAVARDAVDGGGCFEHRGFGIGEEVFGGVVGVHPLAAVALLADDGKAVARLVVVHAAAVCPAGVEGGGEDVPFPVGSDAEAYGIDNPSVGELVAVAVHGVGFASEGEGPGVGVLEVAHVVVLADFGLGEEVGLKSAVVHGPVSSAVVVPVDHVVYVGVVGVLETGVGGLVVEFKLGLG